MAIARRYPRNMREFEASLCLVINNIRAVQNTQDYKEGVPENVNRWLNNQFVALEELAETYNKLIG